MFKKKLKNLFSLPGVDDRHPAFLFRNQLYIWEIRDKTIDRLFSKNELYICYLIALRSFYVYLLVWLIFAVMVSLNLSVDFFDIAIGGQDFRSSFIGYTKISALCTLFLVFPYHAILYRVHSKEGLKAWSGLKSQPKQKSGFIGWLQPLAAAILCALAMYYAADVFLFLRNRLGDVSAAGYFLISSVMVMYVFPCISRMLLVSCILTFSKSMVLRK